MTSEKLHDALNLLPADLVAETDALRTQAKKPQVHWQRLCTSHGHTIQLFSPSGSAAGGHHVLPSLWPQGFLQDRRGRR